MIRIKYIEKILKSIEKKEVLNIRQIKEKSENLEDSYPILNKLEVSLAKHLDNREEFDKIMQMKILISKLKEKSIILENINSFAYYLAVMKVTTLSKDFKKTKRIICSFLKNKDSKLSSLISEVQKFDIDLSNLMKHYESFYSDLGLDNLVDTKEHEEYLKKLKSISVEQKSLIYHIGLNFSETLKVLLRDKEFAKCIL